jgi:Sulfotransferase domain
MKILGVGLSRTGTVSLHSAVKILGFSSLHFDTLRLNDIIDGSNAHPDFRRYDDIDAVMDLPAAYFFEELIAAYPECKCVLTIRDSDKWWRSICRHFNEHNPLPSPGLGFKRRMKRMLRRCLHLRDQHGEREKKLFRIQLRNLVYGSVVAHEYIYKKKYQQHNWRVMNIVPAERLLVMDIPSGDGWSQLCPFLGVPIPAVPFPHDHKGAGTLPL